LCHGKHNEKDRKIYRGGKVQDPDAEGAHPAEIEGSGVSGDKAEDYRDQYDSGA